MKYYYLSIFTLFFSYSTFSQNTYIPDNGFEQLLIDLSVDFGPLDDYVPTANVAGLEDLFILSNYNISDLTGIQDFTSIEALYIENNPITTIDLSGNPILYDVSLKNLNLTSITFSSSSIIAFLDLSNNTISSINLSSLPNLQYLNLEGNSITDLDLSSKTSLTEIYVNNNNLASLTIKNGFNSNLTGFNATNNPSLTCIEVDDEGNATSGTGNYSNWLKDATASYSNDCNSLSIKEDFIDTSISFYPNPVNTESFIKFNNLNHSFDLTVYDLTGKVIDKMKINDNNYEISRLKTGVYFISIVLNNHVYRNKLIVK